MRQDRFFWILCIGMFLSSFGFRINFVDRLAYVLVMGVAISILLVHSLVKSKAFTPFFALLFFLNVMYLLAGIINGFRSLPWLIGDFLIMAAPLTFILIYNYIGIPALSVRKTVILVIAVSAAVSINTIFQIGAGNLFRFKAPSLMLITLAWGLALGKPTPRLAVLGIFLVTLLASLAFLSGSRSAVGFLVLVPFVFKVLQWILTGATQASINATRLRSSVIALVALALVATPAALAVIDEEFVEAFLYGKRGSIEARFIESEDILAQVKSDWTPLNYLLGQGHGATWVPLTVVDSATLVQNTGESGEIHNIHFGPMLIFYRYGVLGSLVFLGIGASFFFSLYQLTYRGVSRPSLILVASGTYLLLSIPNFGFRNVMNGLDFPLMVSAYYFAFKAAVGEGH